MLNADFRKTILESAVKLISNKKILQYSRYVVDSQIVHRDKRFENDKSAYYGFNPIYPLCAVLDDGTIDKRFFEFNIVNHFLKDKDGDSAVEVVKCMLVEWCKENKSIKDFDIDKIDTELAKIEKEYLAKQKEDEKKKQEEQKAKEEQLSCN